jgi:hypothetical protein
MPASPHPNFQPPPTGAKLWRYMTFTKFAALVLDQSLWFARADLLGDEFEASVPKATAAKWRAYIATLPKDRQEAEAVFFRNMCQQQRHSYYVSCWYAQDHESAAMWRVYGRSEECIAVQTTYERLVELLPNYTQCGMVKYFDHNEEGFNPFGNGFDWVMHKRSWFSDEKECRAVIWNAGPPNFEDVQHFRIHSEMNAMRMFGKPIGTNGWTIEHMEPSPASGVSVQLDLNKLLEAIYLGPRASSMLAKLVATLVDRTGLIIPIVRSAMSERPIIGIGGEELHPKVAEGLVEITHEKPKRPTPEPEPTTPLLPP